MLVGRESERRTIGMLLAGARVGDSGVLVLSGEPGIGKTTLLDEAEALAQDMRVLRVQGVQSERFVPFAGLLQLLRPVLPMLDHIPGPQADALSTALLLTSREGGEPSRFAVGAATLSLLSRAAEDQPLAVFVDDAHLLDSPSAEAVVFAARRMVSDPVAVVACVRAGAPGASGWSALPTTVVNGLDLASAEVLVTHVAGPVRKEHVIGLHGATAGNPLALLELARAAETAASPIDLPLPVSERLTRSFIGRVEELSPDTRTALLVAAADSSSAATVFEACSALGAHRPRLDEAEDAGLVTVSGDQVEFRHPLVRSAVYRAADRERRRAVHRALADVMPAHEADRFAWHLSESAVAPDEQVAVTLDELAERASARGAHAIAATALERAAELTGTRSRLAARVASAAEAAWLAGLTEKAVHLLDRALACGPDALLRAHIHELRGAVETRCGSLENALSTLVGAAEAVQPTDVDTAVRLYADAIHVSFYLGDPASAMRTGRAIESMLDSCAHAGTRFLGSMASGMALVLNGAGATGIERVREATYALVVLEAAADDRFRLPLRVQGALWLRDAGPHRQIVTEAIDRLREKAALGSLPYLLMHIARDAATTDAWDDAEAAYDEAITLARETGQSTDLAMSLAGLACLNARRGRVHECYEAVAAAEKLCRSNDIRLGTFWLEFALGDLAAGRDDLTGATAHYETLESHLDTVGLFDPDQSCAPELVEIYVRLGRLEDAHRVATGFAAKAEAKAQPWSSARAERAIGLCEAGASAEARFRAALSRHLETPDSYENARTELAFGAWLRRRRRRVEARTFLRPALQVFEQLGAAPWAEKAAHELRATGETVRRREADAMDDLTPQERQIAQLLAEGRTTRETAAALFISPKTVEYHLRHVYLKLDIRSRAALAERFGSQPRDHTRR